MGFGQHLAKFAGKKVADFTPGEKLANPKTTIPRIRLQWNDPDSGTARLSALLQQRKADELTGLVIGAWTHDARGDGNETIEALVAAADQLPSLSALFLGDIIQDENEVSWIHWCDISPLWSAFPRLEILQLRGSNDLSLGRPAHTALKSLTIQSGGLPASVLHELDKATLPSLEHLELYLGTQNYGWNGSVKDLKKLLSGKLFPKLKYLGLRDSEIADEVAAAAAQAPILERLEVLDLSLGTLTDAGGKALLDSPLISKLKELDLHHHYLSPAISKQLKKLKPKVNVSDLQEPYDLGDEEYRYVAVGE